MIRAAAILATLAASPAAACNVALALGLDASHSITPPAWRAQIEGTAAALATPEVVAAAMSVAPLRIGVYAWATQQGAVAWVEVSAPGDMERVAAAVRAMPREGAGGGTLTAEAMRYGAEQLRAQPCGRLILDLSSDGSPSGPEAVDAVSVEIEAAGDVTINGLAIGPAAVAGMERAASGPSSFVVEAADMAGYQRALVAKLLAELTS